MKVVSFRRAKSGTQWWVAVEYRAGLFWPRYNIAGYTREKPIRLRPFLTLDAAIRYVEHLCKTEFGEEEINGRHRPAEADHQDSGAGTSATSGAGYAKPAGPITAATLNAHYRQALTAHFARGPFFYNQPVRNDFPWRQDPVLGPIVEQEYVRISAYVDERSAHSQAMQFWTMLQAGMSGNVTAAQVAALMQGYDSAEVETVEEDMPILAHRAARLHLVKRRGPVLMSINQGTTLEVDADARCTRGGGHEAPNWNCHCGFYAVPADMATWNDEHTIDLLVELSGTVFEYTKGYRASHQHILEAVLPPCDYCGDPAAAAGWLGPDRPADYFGCALHQPTNVAWFAASVLEERIGVHFTGEKP